MKLLKMYKDWYKLARPNKCLWIIQFITVSVSSICLLIEAYLAARVTTNLTIYNFKMAIVYLVMVFLVAVLHAVTWWINYRNTAPLIASSFYRIQDKIITKLLNSSDKNFEKNSKEKISNIMHNDVYDAAAFSDNICSSFRYLISVILCVGSICFINVWIALAVLVGLVIIYLVNSKINEKIASSKAEQRQCIDDEYEMIDQLLYSKNIANAYNMEQSLKESIKAKSTAFFDATKKYQKATWGYDNGLSMIYKGLILLITLAVMYIYKSNFITLAVYLTIVAYVTDGLTYSKSFLSLFTNFKKAIVSVNRIQIILNFDDRKTLQFGEINKDDLYGEIDFVRVDYKAKNDEFNVSDLYDVSFHISSRQSVTFKGTKNCGKRTIFYLLRRMIDSTKGEMYLDKIKLTDYNSRVYISNLSFVLTKPYFVKGSIMDNMKMVDKNEEKIYRVCKEMNIYDTILQLPNKFDTETSELSQKDAYLLSLARTLLMDSEIILVYEFPYYLGKDEETVRNIFEKLSMDKTILYFTAGDKCDDLSDKIYEVKNGKVKMIKVNPHRKAKLMFDIDDNKK